MAIYNLAASAGATTPVPPGEGGFVQAVYVGNDLATNAVKDLVTVTFGPSTNLTVYTVRAGRALPEGANVANGSGSPVNILVND